MVFSFFYSLLIDALEKSTRVLSSVDALRTEFRRTLLLLRSTPIKSYRQLVTAAEIITIIFIFYFSFAALEVPPSINALS